MPPAPVLGRDEADGERSSLVEPGKDAGQTGRRAVPKKSQELKQFRAEFIHKTTRPEPSPNEDPCSPEATAHGPLNARPHC